MNISFQHWKVVPHGFGSEPCTIRTESGDFVGTLDMNALAGRVVGWTKKARKEAREACERIVALHNASLDDEIADAENVADLLKKLDEACLLLMKADRSGISMAEVPAWAMMRVKNLMEKEAAA